jgi:hypothetical protein
MAGSCHPEKYPYERQSNDHQGEKEEKLPDRSKHYGSGEIDDHDPVMIGDTDGVSDGGIGQDSVFLSGDDFSLSGAHLLHPLFVKQTRKTSAYGAVFIGIDTEQKRAVRIQEVTVSQGALS